MCSLKLSQTKTHLRHVPLQHGEEKRKNTTELIVIEKYFYHQDGMKRETQIDFNHLPTTEPFKFGSPVIVSPIASRSLFSVVCNLKNRKISVEIKFVQVHHGLFEMKSSTKTKRKANRSLGFFFLQLVKTPIQ